MPEYGVCISRQIMVRRTPGIGRMPNRFNTAMWLWPPPTSTRSLTTGVWLFCLGARARLRNQRTGSALCALVVPRLGWQRCKVLQESGDEFRNCRVDVNGALDDRVWRFRVHDIEHGVDHLVASRTQKRRTEDFLGIGVDEHLHEALGLALF